MILVIDASAIVEYLLRTPLGRGMGEHITALNTDLHVPALCDIELASVLRRGLLNGRLSQERATQAVEDYLDLPLSRHGHQELLGPVLAMRDNFSAYDACYAALALSLNATLLTADRPFARSAHTLLGLKCLPAAELRGDDAPGAR